MQENYAQNDEVKVAKIKAIYEELEIKQAYYDYEEKSYSELVKMIDQLSGDLPKEMFIAYAKKIYKRQK